MPSSRTKSKTTETLGLVIDLLRQRGITIESPYDVENFFSDHGSHSKLWKTGRFVDEEDSSSSAKKKSDA
jgi:hypothetical protein